jgi:hypothetical protein
VDRDNESELPATEETDSGRNRRKTNANGLPLTKSGRVSIGRNDINAKYDASYRNPENTTRLLGRALTLGQACGLIGVALFGADIPLEGAGDI